MSFVQPATGFNATNKTLIAIISTQSSLDLKKIKQLKNNYLLTKKIKKKMRYTSFKANSVLSLLIFNESDAS